MADSPLSKVPRSFTVPIMLVGALAAGALVPHLAPSNSAVPAGSDQRGTKSAAPAVVARNDSGDDVDPTLHLLADYLGVDISTASLRRRVLQAADRIADGSPATAEDTAVLRAFFCMDLRWDKDKTADNTLDHHRKIAWSPSQSDGSLPPDCVSTAQRSLDRTSASNLRDDVRRYFNDDTRRDEVVTTRPILGTAPLAVDERKLVAKDFESLNKAPLQWAIVAQTSQQRKVVLQFLVATVPDPIDSYETWQFDPNVDAIRQGIQDSGFLFDRFHLPDVDNRGGADSPSSAARDRHDRWPGVILFRSSANQNAPLHQSNLLVLFLVPETPVAGIHEEPFSRAMDFVSGWMSRHDKQAPVRILGPTFSGATPSIARALVNADAVFGQRNLGVVDVAMVSGSATSDTNQPGLEHVNASVSHLKVTFRATTHSDLAIDEGLRRFLCEAGFTERTAELTESSTGYGAADQIRANQIGHGGGVAKQSAEKSATEKFAAEQNRDTRQTKSKDNGVCNSESKPLIDHTLKIKYPFNIAQLRSDVSREGPARPDPYAALIPGFRPLSLEDVSPPTDQLPLLSPKTTSSAVELVLSNLLDAIQQQHIRVADVDATDIRDKLFLIRKLREHAPDALIVTDGADLFQAHPDQAAWLKGVIVGSTYPLHPRSQQYVYPHRARDGGGFLQFSSVNSQGIYNAAVALLGYRISDGAVLTLDGGQPAPLIDYTGIDSKCVDENGAFEPAVWLSMVGKDQIVPLRVYCLVEEGIHRDEESTSLRYVFRPMRMTPDSNVAAEGRVHLSFISLSAIAAPGLALCAVAFVPYLGASTARRPPKSAVMSMALTVSGNDVFCRGLEIERRPRLRGADRVDRRRGGVLLGLAPVPERQPAALDDLERLYRRRGVVFMVRGPANDFRAAAVCRTDTRPADAGVAAGRRPRVRRHSNASCRGRALAASRVRRLTEGQARVDRIAEHTGQPVPGQHGRDSPFPQTKSFDIVRAAEAVVAWRSGLVLLAAGVMDRARLRCYVRDRIDALDHRRGTRVRLGRRCPCDPVAVRICDRRHPIRPSVTRDTQTSGIHGAVAR